MSQSVDQRLMQRALDLAWHGEGHVEPNPMVGCVIARGDEVLAEGWHAQFGGNHAEVAAIQSANRDVQGATLYVTLEPCCHHGKTPPCTEAILRAQLARVVIAMQDPLALVDGGGIALLQDAGLDVSVGVLQQQAAELMAPYLMRVQHHRPWVMAKWAMTLDGKIATSTGDSQWISGEDARAIVHRLRGRVDAILVGRRTAEQDDPLLTARPPGPRTATRVILDSRAQLPLTSQLVQTAREAPVMIVCSAAANKNATAQLQDAGCEVVPIHGHTHTEQIGGLLAELARRDMTNLFVEGGGAVLGALLDGQWIDEVHAFIAPKLLGGAGSVTAFAGQGSSLISDALLLRCISVETLDRDVYLSGRVERA